MTNNKIDILDQINVDSTASPLVGGESAPENLLTTNDASNVGSFDFLKKYLTKKIYTFYVV